MIKYLYRSLLMMLVLISGVSGILIFAGNIHVEASHHECKDPPDGLAGWWSGDGHLLDYAGNLHGRFIGNTSGYATGEVRQAFDFSGGGDGVAIDGSNEVLGFTKEITIDAWVRPDQIPTQWARIVHKGHLNDRGVIDDHIDYGIVINLDNNTLQPVFNVTVRNNIQEVRPATARLEIGGWTHVAGTYDGETLIIYLNGQEAGRKVLGSTARGDIDASKQPLVIGHNSSKSEFKQDWEGQIDEVEIFNRALRSDEIESIFKYGKCLPGPTADPGGPYIAHEGDKVPFDGSRSRPGAYPIVSYQWEFDDNLSPRFQSGQSVERHYRDNLEFKATLTVTDSIGNTDSDTTDVTIENVAPSVIKTNEIIVPEGRVLDLEENPIIFSDPGLEDEPFRVDILWGDEPKGDLEIEPEKSRYKLSDNREVQLIGVATGKHTYGHAGDYGLGVVITDKDRGVGSVKAIVKVTNLPPSVEPPKVVVPPRNGVGFVPRFIQVSAEYDDPSWLDKHEAEVHCGVGQLMEPPLITRLRTGPPPPQTALGVVEARCHFDTSFRGIALNVPVPFSVRVIDELGSSDSATTTVDVPMPISDSHITIREEPPDIPPQEDAIPDWPPRFGWSGSCSPGTCGIRGPFQGLPRKTFRKPVLNLPSEVVLRD